MCQRCARALCACKLGYNLAVLEALRVRSTSLPPTYPQPALQVEYFFLRDSTEAGTTQFDFSDTTITPCATPKAFASCTNTSAPVPCGNSCIAYGQCCLTDPLQGEQCPSPTVCTADGVPCCEWVGGSKGRTGMK